MAAGVLLHCNIDCLIVVAIAILALDILKKVDHHNLKIEFVSYY